jgi:hypothetical protein
LRKQKNIRNQGKKSGKWAEPPFLLVNLLKYNRLKMGVEQVVSAFFKSEEMREILKI